jgi:hypothetical protein
MDDDVSMALAMSLSLEGEEGRKEGSEEGRK